MKRILILLLAVVAAFTIASCDSSDLPSETDATTTEENLTAKEKLTEQEKRLFDALIKMTTDDFYDPSAVRVLQIGDYINDTVTHYDPEYTSFDDLFAYHDAGGYYWDISNEDSRQIIVVRIQGDNRVGGTLNHFYKISLTTHEDTTECWSYEYRYKYNKSEKMECKAEAGDYVNLGDKYTIETDASDIFNIGNINRALAEYWNEMGF